MKRDRVYYVMPMGDVWLVRAIGSRAEAYPTAEDALAAAERLLVKGAHVRVLSRSERLPLAGPAKTATVLSEPARTGTSS